MMSQNRLRLIVASCSAAIGLMLASFGTAQAQAYPAKPIHIIAGVAPGGPNDLLTRVTAQKLTEALGRPVVVENRAGGGGTIAADYVAKSAPDGYTLLMGGGATLGIAPALFPKLPYDPLRDFTPVSMVAVAPFMLVVHPSLPVKSARDLIALAKVRPGELNYASAGNGSFTHLAMELFKSMAGVNLLHVPYKGVGSALIDLHSGIIHVIINSVATTLPTLRTGKLRGLAVTGAQRSVAVPDMPTIAESGLPGFDANTWFGVVAPAGTPGTIVVMLHAAIVKGLNSAETRDRLLAQGLEPIEMTTDQLAKMIRDELPKWAKVVKISGATASD